MLGGEAVQQNAGFLIGADRSDLQDRSAVAGFNEASVVARLGTQPVKLSGIGRDAALVDGTIERAVASLVPDGAGSTGFQAVTRPQLFLDARHCSREIGIVPSLSAVVSADQLPSPIGIIATRAFRRGVPASSS